MNDHKGLVKIIPDKEIAKTRYPQGNPWGISASFFETRFLIFFLTSTASRGALTQKENKIRVIHDRFLSLMVRSSKCNYNDRELN